MDMTWLASEAKQIHALFANCFYGMVLSLLLLGVIINYFRMPLGHVPEFTMLVGRAILSAFILVALPEIMNTLAEITDQLAAEIGELNNFKLVLSRAGEKIGNLTWSWVSIKDSVLLLVSYLTFFLLYVSVYMGDTLFLFTWTLLYIFSPVLIAAFVLPSTAGATRGLFQSLIEVSCWKITWSVFAALLWSFALSEINKPEYEIDFLTAILLNIMLALSILATPILVGKLLRGGFHSGAAMLGGAVLSAASLTPTAVLGKAGGAVSRGVRSFNFRGGKEDETDFRNRNNRPPERDVTPKGVIEPPRNKS